MFDKDDGPIDLDRRRKKHSLADKLEKIGQHLKAIGCLLTILLTIPMFLTAILGRPGLIVGTLVSFAVLIFHIFRRYD